MAEQENNQDADQDESGGKGKSGLLLWIIASVIALGGGFATPLLIKKASEEKPVEEAKPDAPKAIVEFGEVTVNLNEDRMNRYLRVHVFLAVDKDKEADFTLRLEEEKLIMQNWLLSYFSGKSLEDIRGAIGQNQLRREIKSHFNTILCPDTPPLIRDVLFQEFNVQ